MAGVKAMGKLDATVKQARLDAANVAISQDTPTIAGYAAAFATDKQNFDNG